MSSGSVFSDTLQEITNTKLDELSKRRTAFEEAKFSTLSSIQSQSDPIGRLVLLSDGVKKCFGIKTDKEDKVIINQTKHSRLEIQLKNIDRFLAQARHDPSVSTRALGDWEKGLLGFLDAQSLRFQYASLYGELVTEWLSEPGGQKRGSGGADGGEEDEAYEDVGSAAKLKSRYDWESTVFERADVDVDTLLVYLDSLFGRGDDSDGGEAGNGKRQALQELRENVEKFEAELSRPDQFNHQTLQWAMQGLLSSDLLTNEKRKVLRDFMSNSIILSEIADVLNMRLSALESWSWGPAGVPVEQRRKINGTFSIYMHEDLLQAIFLQYIGVKWSVFFKRAFTAVRDTEGAWTLLQKDIPKQEKARLSYYLGPVHYGQSLQKKRQMSYNRDFFVAKLLRKPEQVFGLVDGEVEAEYNSSLKAGVKRKRMGLGGAVHFQQFATQKIQDCSPEEEDGAAGFMLVDDEEGDVKHPIQLKQQLLHLLSTEIAINNRIHGGLSAFHAVFRDWEVLLPHETICTVLEFLGVSSTWLGFFTRYLQAPLRFPGDYDASQPPRVRRRGMPSSHVLSDVFSETILFCLDLAVNQAACGQPLWRFEDDLWFWSADHQTAEEAWTAVEHFASVTATSVNTDKSGSARISRDRAAESQVDCILPQGEIRWGFLVLSPQTGRFEIDQVMVDSHIAELRQQLNEQKHSVFAFIQTWNTYAAKFFSSNFGKSANCFGRQHVDDMLATHKRIQRQIFSEDSTGGLGMASSIAEYLKKAIEQRCNVTDIPDGYLYFPVELGGLDLRSPFISLLQMRDSVLDSHDSLFETMLGAERDAYQLLKMRFDSGAIKRLRRKLDDPDWQPDSQHDRENFLSFDEFVRYREDRCIMPDKYEKQDICWVYTQLMRKPIEQSVDADTFSEVWTSLSKLKPTNTAITHSWASMNPYWRWVTSMYGPEIVERFGDLSIVDAGLLPMGMVGLFREKRVTWKG